MKALLLLSLSLSGLSSLLASSEYPSQITLRGAVLHAPPFAYVESDDNGDLSYRGFQVDLIERLKIFAAQDNVTLDVALSQAPPLYGPALDLVANDCLSVVENPEESCNQLDMIVGNYYATPDRAMRVDLSPAWLRSTISTIKYTDKSPGSPDYTTLTEASGAGATVCLKDGTFYAGVVKAKYPLIDFLMCPSQGECLDALKAEECVLYASDELQLRFQSAWDATLEVTREQVNTQYIAWPMRDDLPPIVSRLMNRWIFEAVTNATIDELYHEYFQKALCPVGTAGESCELPCDPVHGEADMRGVCVCRSTKWTGDDCSIEVQEDTNMIPTTLKMLAYAMLGINVAVICACGIWLYKYRGTAQVRFSQPFFLLLVLLGCLISSCTIIVLAHEGVQTCMAIPWLYSVGFSVTFGTLLSKILRVYLIFTKGARSEAQGAGNLNANPRRKFGNFRETIGVIGVVLLIDVMILSAWTAIEPLQWARTVVSTDQFGNPLESQGFCTSEHWQVFFGVIAAFHILLIAVACYLCYVARDIPTKFSEGKYVSIAMIR